MRPVCTFLAFAIMPAAMAGEPQLRFLANLEGARPRVSANVAFSPDGKALASSDYDDDGDVSAVKVWDVAKRKVAATFGGPTYRASSVAFSPDGKTLAAAGRDSDGDTIRLWDVATGKEKAAIKASTGDCPVSFSPDGKALAWGGAQAGKTGLVGGRADHLGVKLWDLTAGKEKASLQGHAGPIFTVAFSRDGKLLASGGGEFASNGQAGAGEVKLWAVATGRERVTLSGRGKPPLRVVCSVAFSPDGEALACADGFGTVLLWDVPSGKRRAVLQAFDQGGKEEDANPAYSVAFSPDGKTLAAGTVRGIKLWDVKSGKEVGTVKGASGTVWSVAFSRDGKTVATAGSKRVTGPRDRFGDDPVLRLWEVIPSKKADE